jgi:hypothetical protein
MMFHQTLLAGKERAGIFFQKTTKFLIDFVFCFSARCARHVLRETFCNYLERHMDLKATAVATLCSSKPDCRYGLLNAFIYLFTKYLQ